MSNKHTIKIITLAMYLFLRADLICLPAGWGACVGRMLKDLLRYPLGREGVYGPGVHTFLAHTKQKVSNIVGLTALRLAFFMGYE